MHKARSLTIGEKTTLVLGTTILLGAIVRFAPGMYAGFPLNDGGMFYSMILDLRESHYLLPKTTSYNFLAIPYAYPPFGFYLARILSDAVHISELSLLRWLPPAISTLSILAFYLLAREYLKSPLRGAMGAAFYALTPGSFVWFIMGGGLTRALGSLFLLLAVWSVYRLFKAKGNSPQFLVFAISFSTLAVLSHPEAGIHTAAICLLLWLLFGRTPQNTRYAVLVAIGTVFFSTPWWVSVIRNNGLAPFLSALHSGSYGTPLFKAIFNNVFGDLSYLPVLLVLRMAGMTWSLLRKRHLFLFLWALLPFLVEPRSAPSVVFYPLVIFETIGFAEAFPALFRWFRQRIYSTNGLIKIPKIRLRDGFLFTLAFYLFVESFLYGFRQVNTSLTSAERETMSWVNQNTPVDSTFLLLTGSQAPEIDAFQEWFPALAARRSVNTMQGQEWLLGPRFFHYYRELVALQTCDTVDCLSAWSANNGFAYEYLLLLNRSPGSDLSPALAKDGNYVEVYQTEASAIFKHLR